MYAEERRSKILAYLDEDGSVDTAVLSEKLHVSRETIRRDINTLDANELLVKTHGGAIANRNSVLSTNIPFIQRQHSNSHGKSSIAKQAASYIAASDNVFMDNSTTVAEVVKYLNPEMRLTILTNSIPILLEISKIKTTNWTVFSTGGELRPGTLSTSGFLTSRNLAQFKPSKAFLSCHGIDKELEITDGNIYDAETKSLIIGLAKTSFLLVDKEKFGASGVIKVTDIYKFDYVITEKQSDCEIVEKIRGSGVKLDIV